MVVQHRVIIIFQLPITEALYSSNDKIMVVNKVQCKIVNFSENISRERRNKNCKILLNSRNSSKISMEIGNVLEMPFVCHLA